MGGGRFFGGACNFRPQSRKLVGIPVGKAVSGIPSKKVRELAGRVTRAKTRKLAYPLDRGVGPSMIG